MTVITRAAAKRVQGPAVSGDGNLFQGGDNGVGNLETSGFDGAIILVLQKTGAGTCSVTPQVCDDGGVIWYNHGYQRTDGQATLARATGPIAVTTGTFNARYQVLDPGSLMRFVVSASSGSFALTPIAFISPL